MTSWLVMLVCCSVTVAASADCSLANFSKAMKNAPSLCQRTLAASLIKASKSLTEETCNNAVKQALGDRTCSGIFADQDSTCAKSWLEMLSQMYKDNCAHLYVRQSFVNRYVQSPAFTDDLLNYVDSFANY